MAECVNAQRSMVCSLKAMDTAVVNVISSIIHACILTLILFSNMMYPIYSHLDERTGVETKSSNI